MSNRSGYTRTVVADSSSTADSILASISKTLLHAAEFSPASVGKRRGCQPRSNMTCSRTGGSTVTVTDAAAFAAGSRMPMHAAAIGNHARRWTNLRYGNANTTTCAGGDSPVSSGVTRREADPTSD